MKQLLQNETYNFTKMLVWSNTDLALYGMLNSYDTSFFFYRSYDTSFQTIKHEPLYKYHQLSKIYFCICLEKYIDIKAWTKHFSFFFFFFFSLFFFPFTTRIG